MVSLVYQSVPQCFEIFQCFHLQLLSPCLHSPSSTQIHHEAAFSIPQPDCSWPVLCTHFQVCLFPAKSLLGLSHRNKQAFQSLTSTLISMVVLKILALVRFSWLCVFCLCYAFFCDIWHATVSSLNSSSAVGVSRCVMCFAFV